MVGLKIDYKAKLQTYLEREVKVMQSIDLDSINEVMNILEAARMDSKRIFVCGNGGSAATASHYCNDFNNGWRDKDETKYNFECLSDNIPSMMTIANDIGYEQIFRLPLMNKMRAGDILIGISCSGNSQNVINAMEYTKSIGGSTIAIVGYSGGKMKEIADLSIHVCIENMQIAEDIHLIINHLMLYVLTH